MTIQRATLVGIGGAISIGTEREEEQDPTPDGEELPEDEEEVEEVKRDPDPVPEDDVG
jgi:hypothetical protein